MQLLRDYSLVRDYTTVLSLLLSCAVFSVLTLRLHYPEGAAGGRQLAGLIQRQAPRGASVLIVVRNTGADAQFASAADEQLRAAGYRVLQTVHGQPSDARAAIEAAANSGQKIDVLAGNDVTAKWEVLSELQGDAQLVRPAGYYWPTFLKLQNLLNIPHQIALVAIIAIGMTMVIIAGGIDLSVGSLIALSSVVAARLIRDLGGGTTAGPIMVAACLSAAVVLCAAIGALNGALSAAIRIPPFIVTLAMMYVASGLAFRIAGGNTIDEVPSGISRLMTSKLLGVPSPVVLMLLLFALADVVMKRTVFGRHLYALGGNRRAAWLSGISVWRVELLSYVVCSALAGLAGVLMLADYRAGGPKYGVSYELQVIAAVVVGGTSLSGGQGKMFGTLLGALLIGVVSNGMNLLDLRSDVQQIVLGLVILAAALLDRLKQRRES